MSRAGGTLAGTSGDIPSIEESFEALSFSRRARFSFVKCL